MAEELHEEIFGVTLDQHLFHVPAPFSPASPPAHCTIVLAEYGNPSPEVPASDLVESFEALGLSPGGTGGHRSSAPPATFFMSDSEPKGAHEVLCGCAHRQVAREAFPPLFPITRPPDMYITSSTEGADTAFGPSRLNTPSFFIVHDITDSPETHRPILGLEIPFGALPELTLFNCVTAIVRPVLF